MAASPVSIRPARPYKPSLAKRAHSVNPEHLTTNIYFAHRKPKDFSDRVALFMVRMLRWGTDLATGYKHNVASPKKAEDSNAVAGHSPGDTTASTPVKPSPAATVPVSTPPAATQTPVRPAPAPPVPSASVPVPEGASLYHFVILATSNKFHALKRYNQLLGYQLNIKMDQKDSSYFKLYFPIAAPPRDTTQIKDSLADVYAAPHVFIEH